MQSTEFHSVLKQLLSSSQRAHSTCSRIQSAYNAAVEISCIETGKPLPTIICSKSCSGSRRVSILPDSRRDIYCAYFPRQQLAQDHFIQRFKSHAMPLTPAYANVCSCRFRRKKRNIFREAPKSYPKKIKSASQSENKYEIKRK